jgi:large subunit ribosomal protein L29
MKVAELRELPDDELLARLEGLREELFNLRFQDATGQLDNPMRIKEVRHDVARLLTILRGRSSEEELRLAVEEADRRSLEDRREAIASGELKGRSLTEVTEEAQIEAAAAAGAEYVPDVEGEDADPDAEGDTPAGGRSRRSSRNEEEG